MDLASSVQIPSPVFVKKPESQSVCEGSSFEFVCQVQQQPNIKVTWMKDDSSSLPDKYYASSEGEIHKLWCGCAAFNDAGRFVCVASNGSVEKCSMVELIVTRNVQQSQDKSHYKSESFDSSKGHHQTNINNKDRTSTKLNQENNQKVSTTDATISSTSVSYNNARVDPPTINTSTFRAASSLDHSNNMMSSYLSKSVTSYNSITLSSASKTSKSNLITKKFNNCSGISNQTTKKVVMNDDDGQPKYDLKENKEDIPKKISRQDTCNIINSEEGLEISNKSSIDMLYSTETDITKGELVSKESELSHIKCSRPEVVHLQPENLHVLRGSDLTLTASFNYSSNDLQIIWYKGANEIFPDQRTEIEIVSSWSTLKIFGSVPQDSECYTISVKNKFGSDQLSSSVTVEDRPEPPFKHPAVSSITNNSLVLSWYGPVFDGGSPLLGYKIEQLQFDESGNELGWKTLSQDCQHTTYFVRNLKESTKYKFRISCNNKHGFSEPGIPSKTIMTSEESLSSPKMVCLHPSRKFHEHYRLGDIIGRGKFGVVQECFDQVSNQKFAVKVIKFKQSQAADFRQEVAIMNELHHPKLLQLRDAFECKKEAFLVMEFIAGRELLERITTEDYSLTEGDCVYYVKQICEGIGYMHQKKILHLDLKLENILCLTEHGKDIKIIDFGLSRVYKTNENLKIMCGTPEFVAPEVINFDPVSPPSDMWSLGVITYILLSGFSPFSGDNDSDTLCNITKAHYDFEEGFDGISEQAKNFITSLLIKDPKKRMTSLECLKHDWLVSEEENRMSKRLSTFQHKKFLNRRRWQKSGNALRALSRLTGESKILQRPRGMSVDRKMFLIKLLNRNTSKDDGVFDDLTPRKNKKRSVSIGGIIGRSRSLDDLVSKGNKKHAAVCKVLSCVVSPH